LWSRAPTISSSGRASAYDELSEDEQVAEDETAVVEQEGQTVITVPDKLLPAIRQLLAASSQT
jgi:hypothetical protein